MLNIAPLAFTKALIDFMHLSDKRTTEFLKIFLVVALPVFSLRIAMLGRDPVIFVGKSIIRVTQHLLDVLEGRQYFLLYFVSQDRISIIQEVMAQDCLCVRSILWLVTDKPFEDVLEIRRCCHHAIDLPEILGAALKGEFLVVGVVRVRAPEWLEF